MLPHASIGLRNSYRGMEAGMWKADPETDPFGAAQMPEKVMDANGSVAFDPSEGSIPGTIADAAFGTFQEEWEACNRDMSFGKFRKI